MPCMSANLKTSNEEKLLALNAEYIRCVDQSDAAGFRRFLAEDFVCGFPDGAFVDREEFLRRSAQPSPVKAIEAHDVDVRIEGTVAVVRGRTTFRKADGTLGAGCYTDIYALRGGEWLCIGAHVTRR